MIMLYLAKHKKVIVINAHDRRKKMISFVLQCQEDNNASHKNVHEQF